MGSTLYEGMVVSDTPYHASAEEIPWLACIPDDWLRDRVAEQLGDEEAGPAVERTVGGSTKALAALRAHAIARPDDFRTGFERRGYLDLDELTAEGDDRTGLRYHGDAFSWLLATVLHEAHPDRFKPVPCRRVRVTVKMSHPDAGLTQETNIIRAQADDQAFCTELLPYIDGHRSWDGEHRSEAWLRQRRHGPQSIMPGQAGKPEMPASRPPGRSEHGDVVWAATPVDQRTIDRERGWKEYTNELFLHPCWLEQDSCDGIDFEYP